MTLGQSKAGCALLLFLVPCVQGTDSMMTCGSADDAACNANEGGLVQRNVLAKKHVQDQALAKQPDVRFTWKGLYTEGTCTQDDGWRSEPHGARGRLTNKIFFDQCQKNVAGQNVIFSCHERGVIRETPYADEDEDCSGESGTPFNIRQGECNEVDLDGTKKYFEAHWTGKCMLQPSTQPNKIFKQFQGWYDVKPPESQDDGECKKRSKRSENRAFLDNDANLDFYAWLGTVQSTIEFQKCGRNVFDYVASWECENGVLRETTYPNLDRCEQEIRKPWASRDAWGHFLMTNKGCHFADLTSASGYYKVKWTGDCKFSSCSAFNDEETCKMNSLCSWNEMDPAAPHCSDSPA